MTSRKPNGTGENAGCAFSRPGEMHCERCTSHLEWIDIGSRVTLFRFKALGEAEVALLRGEVLGLVGHGISHLVVDARREESVGRIASLAGSKGRPLPVMFQSVDSAASHFDIPAETRDALAAGKGIVAELTRKRGRKELPLAPSVNPSGGSAQPVTVAGTSLHFLFLGRVGCPVVAVVARDEKRAAEMADSVLYLHCPAYAYFIGREGALAVFCGRGRVPRRDAGGPQP